MLFSSLFTHGALVKDSHSDAALEVQPDSRQHFRGGNFTLHCSVKGINSTGWILRRLQEAKTRSGCLQLNGTESTDRPEECHFIDIDYGNSGLYWCESPAENKSSNTINITVSCKNVIVNNVDPNHTDLKIIVFIINTRLTLQMIQTMKIHLQVWDTDLISVIEFGMLCYNRPYELCYLGSLVWVSGLCVVLILLVLLLVLWLLFPVFR